MKIWEPLRTFLFLGIAASLAFYLTSTYGNSLENLADLLHVSRTYLTDPKFILPFLTPIVYMMAQVIYGMISPWMYKVPAIRLFFDKKLMFVGSYLSLPAKQDELNIFKITFLGGYYKLQGYAYSLVNKELIGDWKSSKLDMETTEPVALSYIYEGKRYSQGTVRGHVYIKFEGKKPDNSAEGYWIDVNDVGKTEWTPTRYVKLTGRIRKKIFANWIFLEKDFPFVRIRRWINKPRSVIDAYYGRKDELNKDVEFKRPDRPGAVG